MKKINLIRFLPIIIIAVGIIFFVLLKTTQPEPQPVSIKKRIWQVETITAKPETLTPTLTLYGKIETPERVNAAAPGNSRVVFASIREGDKISQGQILLNLDPRDFEPQVTQAEARVAELQALITSEQLRFQADRKSYSHERSLINLNQSAVKRAEMLKEKKLGSKATLEQAQEALERQRLSLSERKLSLDDHDARLQQLNARLKHAEASLELVKLDMERSRIIAPFDGYVEKLLVAAGEQVKENQILLTFYPYDKLEVRATIPATFQYELQRAISQGEKLSASSDLPGITIKLELDRFSGLADARGVDGLFNITQGNDFVRIGSTLSISLQRPAVENVVALPFSALYDDDRIYKLADGRFKGIKVRRHGEYINGAQNIKLLVSSPQLKNGDKIIVTHLPNAINGLRAESR